MKKKRINPVKDELWAKEIKRVKINCVKKQYCVQTGSFVKCYIWKFVTKMTSRKK